MSKHIHDLLGKKVVSDQENEVIFEAYYGGKDPIITDHRVYGLSVVPGSLHIARLIATLSDFYKAKFIDIPGIVFKNPLVLKDTEVRIVRLIIYNKHEQQADFKIISSAENYSPNDENAWVLHAQGKLIVKQPKKDRISDKHIQQRVREIQARCVNNIDIAKFDEYFREHKLSYGSSFKWFEKITCFEAESLSYMRAAVPGPEIDKLILSPGQIDCALQAFISIIFDIVQTEQESDAWILGGMREIKIYQAPKGKLICYNQLPNHATFTATSRSAVGNITFFDSEGNLVAEFIEVLVIKVTPEQMSRFIRA